MTGPARGVDTVGRPEEGLSDLYPLFAKGLSRANAWKHHLGLHCWLCRADQHQDSALGYEGTPLLPVVGEQDEASMPGQWEEASFVLLQVWQVGGTGLLVCPVYTCLCCHHWPLPLSHPHPCVFRPFFLVLWKWLLAPGLSPPITGAPDPVPLLLQLLESQACCLTLSSRNFGFGGPEIGQEPPDQLGNPCEISPTMFPSTRGAPNSLVLQQSVSEARKETV